MLRRGLFFAHRNLSEILDDLEANKQIFLYTGRGPSSSGLHLGHYLPMEFTVWLQKVFNAVVVFQMADDEKYWFKDMEFDNVYQLGFENAKDVIALGFDPEKTFIFSNRDFSRMPSYQKVAFDILKNVKINQIKAIFGIEDGCCAGQLMWPIYQTTAAFSQAFEPLFGKENVRCLISLACDQDPYFRMARDVAPRLRSGPGSSLGSDSGFAKPCEIICRFLPALEGDAKMSSTATGGVGGPSRTVFMSDTKKEIHTKIMKYAFSGGQETVKLHRELGGNPDVDISFQWLRHFLEDDNQLNQIEADYRSGELLTGELKKITVDVIADLLTKHQAKRASLTDADVQAFYDISNVKV